MEFWKTHAKSRVIIIIVLFVVGLILTIAGWRMTGKLTGLLEMIAGVVCLLIALWFYNKPFAKTPKKKS